METLHDDYDGRGSGIVQASRDRFAKDARGTHPLGFRLRCLRRMRVIDDDAIAPPAGKTWDRHAFPKASGIVGERKLSGTYQAHFVAPEPLIPFARDQIAHPPAIALDVGLGIG